MSVYLIALIQPSQPAWDNLAAQWPDRHHIINDRMAMVAPPDISTAHSVRSAIGMTTEPQAPSGIIVPLDLHSGVLPTAAVDWLRQAEEAGG